MRIALSSYTATGAWWALRLMAEGHKVDYFLSKPEYEDVLSGLIPKPKLLSLDHRRHLGGYGYPSYKGYDLSLFDLTGRPKQADASRREAPTLGDGEFEHLLEDDREFGLRCMEECGISVPPYQRFDTPAKAKQYIRDKNTRLVYKPFTKGSEGQDADTTYVSKSPEDLLDSIDHLFQVSKRAPFILQDYVKGIEASCEGMFNGEDFFLLVSQPEEKKFMNDNKGPNTGCAGNLVFTVSTSSRLYEESLKKAIPLLKTAGFRGILDLNFIISDEKLYALEWTPRFGYMCCPTVAHMYGPGYGDVLAAIASGGTPLQRWKWSFGAAVTLSIPPYPTEIRVPKAANVPVKGISPEDITQLQEYFLYDVKLNGKGLITSGNYGYLGAAIAGGNNPGQAFEKVKHRVEKLEIPNLQYRTDVEKCSETIYSFLERNSWL